MSDTDELIRDFDNYDQVLLFLIKGIKPVDIKRDGRIIKWQFKHGDVKELEDKFNRNEFIPVDNYHAVISANAVWKAAIASNNSKMRSSFE